MKGCPDHLQEVTRYGRCLPCDTERNIRFPKLEFTRDPPTGDPLPLPSERQWKDGMKWQRR